MEKKIVNRYNNKLSQFKLFLSCNICRVFCKVSTMSKHMKRCHGINGRVLCIWCLKCKFKSELTKEEKYRKYKHKLVCFDNYIQNNPSREIYNVDESKKLQTMSTVNIYVSGFLYNSKCLQEWAEEVERETQKSPRCSNKCYPNWLTNIDGVSYNNLQFFNNKCTIDPLVGFDPFFQLAFSFKDNLKWWSLRVDNDQWKLFVFLITQNATNLYILPHSCLCSHGGVLHRHLIVIVAPGCKISFSDTTVVSYARLLDRNDPMHLVSLIVMLSRKNCGTCTNNCHYYVFWPVMPCSELIAMLYIPRGLEHYCKRISITENLTLNTLHFSNGKWSVQYRELLQYLHIIFPLPSNYELQQLTDMSSTRILDDFLIVGYRFYRVVRNDNLSNMTCYQWNMYQIQNQNCLYFNVGQQFYTLSPEQQESLNSLLRNRMAPCNLQLERYMEELHMLRKKTKILENNLKGMNQIQENYQRLEAALAMHILASGRDDTHTDP